MICLAAALFAAAALRYDVSASPGARELTVEARIAAFSTDQIPQRSVDSGAKLLRDPMNGARCPVSPGATGL